MTGAAFLAQIAKQREHLTAPTRSVESAALHADR